MCVCARACVCVRTDAYASTETQMAHKKYRTCIANVTPTQHTPPHTTYHTTTHHGTAHLSKQVGDAEQQYQDDGCPVAQTAVLDQSGDARVQEEGHKVG